MCPPKSKTNINADDDYIRERELPGDEAVPAEEFDDDPVDFDLQRRRRELARLEHFRKLINLIVFVTVVIFVVNGFYTYIIMPMRNFSFPSYNEEPPTYGNAPDDKSFGFSAAKNKKHELKNFLDAAYIKGSKTPKQYFGKTSSAKKNIAGQKIGYYVFIIILGLVQLILD